MNQKQAITDEQLITADEYFFRSAVTSDESKFDSLIDYLASVFTGKQSINNDRILSLYMLTGRSYMT
jgi:hypothetical protein